MSGSSVNGPGQTLACLNDAAIATSDHRRDLSSIIILVVCVTLLPFKQADIWTHPLLGSVQIRADEHGIATPTMQHSRGLACLGLPHSDDFMREDSLLKLCAGSVSSRRKLGMNDGTASSENAIPRLEVRPSEGRGFGMFTLDSIPAYSRIMCEDALLCLGEGEDLPQLWEKYCALPSQDQAEFDALAFPQARVDQEPALIAKLRLRGYDAADSERMARISSKYHANAFNTGANLGEAGSHHWRNCVYARIARINHSCAPNAIAHYRPQGVQAVYALQDIKPGGEIEMSYFDPTMSFSERQSRAEDWGFTCTCPVCRNNTLSRWNQYEQRLVVVRWHYIMCFSKMSTIEQIKYCQEAIDTALDPEYPWLRAALSKLYMALYTVEKKASGDLMTMDRDKKIYLRTILDKIAEWQEKITGTGSRESLLRRQLLREFDIVAEAAEDTSPSTKVPDPRLQQLQWEFGSS